MATWHIVKNLNVLRIWLTLLYFAGERAKQNLASSQNNIKYLCDHKSKEHQFSTDDQVLAQLDIMVF